MTREIKFRLWDNELKEMSTRPGVYQGHVRNSIIFQLLANDPERFIPMQWTGLLDKNGKEIYEGDLIHQLGYINGFNHEVVYIDSRFCLSYNGVHSDYIPSTIVEVVDNVYETSRY